ncbi:unnamed protein product [Linum trigynum]|uniref:Uncharacterized protein n=1 Tax=Linum trigynum TaxID=586398 RepID=A0AAV2CE59_9ROSI
MPNTSPALNDTASKALIEPNSVAMMIDPKITTQQPPPPMTTQTKVLLCQSGGGMEPHSAGDQWREPVDTGGGY